MPSRALKRSTPAKSLLVCCLIAIPAFLLIGFPGICGFTGPFGDRLASTTIGLCVAMALTLLPILGIFLSLIWLAVVALTRLIHHDPRPTA